MRDHPLIVLPLPDEEGGGWLALAPDLWGCMGDGPTPEAAVRDFADAFRAWSAVQGERGDPLPKPGSFLAGLMALLTAEQAAEVRRRLHDLAPVGEPPAARPAAAAE